MNNGKICVSVCAKTADEMIAKIREAETIADVIELRFDCLAPAELDRVIKIVGAIECRRPILATYRSPEQGGEREISREERLRFWAALPENVWAADLEEDISDISVAAELKIVSHHDHAGVPSDLTAIYERLAGSECDVTKIAVTADDITDTIPVWKLLERAKADQKQIIPIAMGDAGKWTRILGLTHGAFMTYASLGSGNETAPGQITAKDLAEVFRVKELDRSTKVFGVIGDPISQSLSPYMHNPAFAATGINAVFVSLLVKDLDAFIRRMVRPGTREVELNFGGFSVTMPHKQAIMPHLDAIDPIAEKIGAVNTVKIDGGKLTGYNTDAHGFITPLKAKLGDICGARVAVFGAGGAARAVVYALRQENADVTVYARDHKKAEAFAEEFTVRAETLPDSNGRNTKLAADFDVLVDATPLGMKGPHETATLFTADELDGLKLVYDLVTKPTDTPILREAKLAGVPTLGGLEMLVAQGVRQFEIWNGHKAPAERMRKSVLARINELQA